MRPRYVFISAMDTASGLMPAFLRASMMSKGVWRELSASMASYEIGQQRAIARGGEWMKVTL